MIANISSLSKKLSKEIEEVTKKVSLTQPTGNEKTLQSEIQSLIKPILKKLGVDTFVILEKRSYKSRRSDVIYPEVILEYKGTSLLKTNSVKKKAFDELFDYIFGEIIKTRKKIVGYALDGEQLIFVKPKTEKLLQLSKSKYGKLKKEKKFEYYDTFGPDKIEPIKIESLLIHLRQLGKKVLSSNTLTQDFGPTSSTASKIVQLLYKKITDTSDTKVNTIFDEWNKVLGIIYGENFEKAKKKVAIISELYGISKKADLKKLFFSIQTYFAIFMKILASEVLALQNPNIDSFTTKWALLNDSDLKKEFEQMEAGGIFKTLGINNFLEGIFFSWYLQEWDKEVAAAIREISKKLSEYEIATTTIEPEMVSDLLKQIYQNLIPKNIRHDLGEYYTPDWLADALLNEIGFDGSLSKRILDPACGSGTFLVMAIKRIFKKQNKKIVNNREEIFKKILENFAGIDINPIAVLSARTNFVIATSAIQTKLSDVEIPIYYADSVLTPSLYPGLLSSRYKINTSVGDFSLTQKISQKQVIVKILDILNEVIKNKGKLEVFLNRVSELITDPTDEDLDDLKELFSKIQELQKQGKDSIWTNIIKNNFAPVYLGQFDFVIGNPPWIPWENLSSEYRSATEFIWKNYRLQEKKATAGATAQSSIDFSSVMTYVSSNNYLNKNGKLAFLLPQGLFQSENRGRGFRRFSILLPNSQIDLKVHVVHDLSSFYPFEAANQTSFIVIERGKQTVYPINYILWTPKSSIFPTMTLEEVNKKMKKEKKYARPVDKNDKLSSWLIGSKNKFSKVSKILGKSYYHKKAFIGADTMGYNAIYWVKPIEKRI